MCLTNNGGNQRAGNGNRFRPNQTRANNTTAENLNSTAYDEDNSSQYHLCLALFIQIASVDFLDIIMAKLEVESISTLIYDGPRTAYDFST